MTISVNENGIGLSDGTCYQGRLNLQLCLEAHKHYLDTEKKQIERVKIGCCEWLEDA